jgi:hypothetical protein
MTGPNLKGSPTYQGHPLRLPTPAFAEDPGDAFAQLIALSDAKGSAQSWLDRHRHGRVPPSLAAAQAVLDRAVEGGFFDEFEGASGTSIEVRRRIQDAAGLLLGDPSTEVWLAEERFECPVEGVPKWRTRLLAVPR